MNAPLRKPPMTLDAFLAFEDAAPTRHEFVGGEVFAMAGGSEAHARIIGNLHAALWQALAGGRCHPYKQSMRVITPASDVYYPDIVVDCAPASRPGPATANQPSVIIEVLSPSTSDFDLGGKRVDYQTLAALQHYVAVWTDRMQSEISTREAGGWHVETLIGPEATLDLMAIGPVAIVMTRIYAGVDFTAPPAPDTSA
jgi:Uma2 family endonuclease